MAQQFIASLQKQDWEKLDKIAKSKGFNNFRDSVPQLLKQLAEDESLLINFSCKDRRTKNNFGIPPELQDFYINLACKNCTSVSGAIMRYVILPNMIQFDIDEKLIILGG